MNIMELGAIGELVGGVAVIATLIYLAMQVRQSNRQEQAEHQRVFWQHWNHMVHDPLRNRDTVRVIQAASQNFADLEAEEQLISHGYWEAMFVLGIQAFDERQKDPSLAQVINTFLVQLRKMPGATQWWESGGSVYFPSEYLAYLDSLDAQEVRALDAVVPWFGPRQTAGATEA